VPDRGENFNVYVTAHINKMRCRSIVAPSLLIVYELFTKVARQFRRDTHTYSFRGLNKRLADRNLNNEIVGLGLNIVVTGQSLINVTIKISVNKISIKETCSTFWKQSIMFAWSEVVIFCSCGE